MRRALLTLILIATATAGCSRGGDSGAATALTGTFALPGKAQTVDAKLLATFGDGRDAQLDLSETQRPGGALVTSYDTDMTKKLHMIVISDDLTTFQHVHPMLGADGHFTMHLKVPASGGYHVYADTVPHGDGQQVFRFDVPFGNTLSNTPDLSVTPATAHAGPYAVTLDKLKLDAGGTTMLTVHVTKNGKPAKDLASYLGGAAHAVFINAKDLSYLHVHPIQGNDAAAMGDMAMGDMKELSDSAKVNPMMMLHVAAPSAGTYKLWLQFRGGGRLYVVPFVLTAA